MAPPRPLPDPAAHGAHNAVVGRVDHLRNGFDPLEVLIDFDGGEASTDRDGATERAPAVPGTRLVGLAALAGLPAVPGVYVSFASTPWAATLVLGFAAGAVAEVLRTIGGGMLQRRTLVTGPGATGLLAGFVVMLATGLLVTT